MLLPLWSLPDEVRNVPIGGRRTERARNNQYHVMVQVRERDDIVARCGTEVLRKSIWIRLRFKFGAVEQSEFKRPIR